MCYIKVLMKGGERLGSFSPFLYIGCKVKILLLDGQ